MIPSINVYSSLHYNILYTKHTLCIFMTCSTFFCHFDKLMDPGNVCMYMCVCVCVYLLTLIFFADATYISVTNKFYPRCHPVLLLNCSLIELGSK